MGVFNPIQKCTGPEVHIAGCREDISSFHRTADDLYPSSGSART